MAAKQKRRSPGQWVEARGRTHLFECIVCRTVAPGVVKELNTYWREPHYLGSRLLSKWLSEECGVENISEHRLQRHFDKGHAGPRDGKQRPTK